MSPNRVLNSACAVVLVAVAACKAAPVGLTLTEFRKQSAAAAAKAKPPTAARYRPKLIVAYPPNVFYGGPGAPQPGAWPIRLAPDGQKAVFYWYSTRGGLVYVDRKTQSTDRILAQDQPLDMAFSPDGGSLAMVTDNIKVVGGKSKAHTADLIVVALATGKKRLILRCPFDLPPPARKKPGSFIAACGWVGAGKIAAYVVKSGKARIVLVDVASRATKVLFDCEQAEKKWPPFREIFAEEPWRPWGQRLSVTGRGEVYFCWKGRIFRTTVATGKTELLADPALPCSSPLADADGRRFLVAAGDDDEMAILMLFDREFGGGQVVTSCRTGGAGLSDNVANWFADGKHLAVADRGSAVLATADGRHRVKIPLAAGQICLGVVPIGADSLVVGTSRGFWRIDVAEQLRQLDAAAAAAKQPKYPDFATPKAAIRTCLEAVRRKDMKTLLTCIVPSQKAFLDQLTKQAGGDSRRSRRMLLQLALTLASPCELGEPRVTIEGDTASAVGVSGATVNLVKRRGQWKIHVTADADIEPVRPPSPTPPRAAADTKPDISALIRALRKDNDADARSRAVKKLGPLLWHLRRTDESRAREVLPQLLAVGSEASMRLVLLYSWGFYDSVDPKVLARLRTLARKSVADAKANRFLRIRSAMFLGAKGEQADVGLLRKVLAAMGRRSKYRWSGSVDSGPESPRQAIWIGLARLGDTAAKRHIEGALAHAEAGPRLWGLLAAVHVGGREWIARIEPLLDDARKGMLVIRARRVEGGDFEMNMSVAAVAARAIYTLARPKPDWSFAVQPFGRCGGLRPGIELDASKSVHHVETLLMLSAAQRMEIRGWIKRSAVKAIPIVFDLGGGRAPLPRLALAGKRANVCGMLCNRRFFQESPQRQCLLSFPPGRPLAQYTIELPKPIRKLPASYPQYADPPDKNLVGPYRIVGRLDAGRGNTYRLTAGRAEPMKVDAEILRLCEKTVAARWLEIAQHRPAVAKNAPRPPSLGEFVKRIKPRLMGVSVDGGELLVICALGRALLPIHAEAHARVYCHVDAKRKTVLGIYVRTGTTMLE